LLDFKYFLIKILNFDSILLSFLVFFLTQKVISTTTIKQIYPKKELKIKKGFLFLKVTDKHANPSYNKTGYQFDSV